MGQILGTRKILVSTRCENLHRGILEIKLRTAECQGCCTLRNTKCKEIEENKRMGKTTALFKKIRDTKGTFHEKIGSIKDRNGMDLTAEKILRRGGKNT